MPISYISTVLCTRNRASVLPKAVRSIFEAGQRLRNAMVELILVDNGSTDGTASVMRQLAENAPIPVILLEEPIAGVCRAKNTGVRAAIGDIVSFTDDDCILAPDYFEALLRHFAADDGPVIRGGRVELGDEADLAFTIKTETAPDIYDGAHHPGGFLHGCNLAVRRAVFEAVGLFDEDFGPGGPFRAAEDTEFVYRSHKAGFPVFYEPDMVVFHHHGRRNLSDIADLMWSYQIGNGALHAKHGLTDDMLSHDLYCNMKYLLKESFGGRKFDPKLDLSHREIVLPQLIGILRYLARPARSEAPPLNASRSFATPAEKAWLGRKAV